MRHLKGQLDLLGICSRPCNRLLLTHALCHPYSGKTSGTSTEWHIVIQPAVCLGISHDGPTLVGMAAIHWWWIRVIKAIALAVEHACCNN